jgi:hypothetical protein
VTYELVSVYATPFDGAKHYIGRARDTSDGLVERQFVYHGIPAAKRTSETWLQFDDALVYRVGEIGLTDEPTNPIVREVSTEKGNRELGLFDTPYPNNSYALTKSSVTRCSLAFVYARTRKHEKASRYAEYQPEHHKRMRGDAGPAAVVAVTINPGPQPSTFSSPPPGQSRDSTLVYRVIVARPEDARGFVEQAISHMEIYAP